MLIFNFIIFIGLLSFVHQSFHIQTGLFVRKLLYTKWIIIMN